MSCGGSLARLTFVPARKPSGPPPPPVVQRVRLRYAKRGRMRFSSHRDFQRSLERALRRAKVPMAYSAGFRPHPKISFAGAAPTGAASEAEYFELGLATRVVVDELVTLLDEAMPDGLDIVEGLDVGAPGEANWSLPDRLTGSVWQIEIADVAVDVLESAVTTYLSHDSVIVERVTQKGRREIDTRAAVVEMSVAQTDLCAILNVVVRHITPAVRPDDLLTALREVADLAPATPPKVTRLTQGLLDADAVTVADPFRPG